MANMKYLLNYRSFISLMVLFSFFDNFGMKIEEKEYDYLFKVLFVGDSGVGKTQIINKFVENNFLENCVSTIGVDFKIKEVEFKNKKIKLQLWDTAGQERFRAIIQNYYKSANLIAFVYAINNRNSFNSIPKWVDEVKKQTDKNTKFLLVGNKCDLEEERQVSREEAEKYAEDNGIKFFEVSAKTRKGINDMFKYIISEPLKEKEPGLFDNQYKNNIKINKTFCWSEYCSCCTCLNNSKEEDIKLDIF